jgi:hypothetical protein
MMLKKSILTRKLLLLPILVLLTLLLSCSTNKNVRKRKDCDCPKWSKIDKMIMAHDEKRV